jgi:hypothetical protein
VSPVEAAILRGEARPPGGDARPATVTLGVDGFSVALGDEVPWPGAYRDVTQVLVDGGTALVQLGAGPHAERWLFERFGPRLGALVRGLRDGRLRQWLSDGLIEADASMPVDLVEFSAGGSAGVAQLLYHDRGVAFAPLDEGLPRFRVRRSDIGAVTAILESGRLQVAGVDGPLARGRAMVDDVGQATGLEGLELLGLGASATSHRRRWSALRDAAAADMAGIVASLVPDLPFEQRRLIESTAREGRPVDAATLGDAWAPLEAAVLGEPDFAASYRALVTAAGGRAAPRWLALAPDAPGRTEPPRAWFLVGLPGNLVALELVSAGAHATYCFRVEPRAAYGGGEHAPEALLRAVLDVSEALLDARFLREPLAIPDARLVEPRHLRYRLALRALPGLATARARFVARIAHRDQESWAEAVRDLVAWHGSVRDEGAEWPGRAAQEAAVDESETGTAGPVEG